MFRVFINQKTSEYSAVEVGNPKRNFAFDDWRYFSARLKREMEHDAEISLHADAVEAEPKSLSEDVEHGERRRTTSD